MKKTIKFLKMIRNLKKKSNDYKYYKLYKYIICQSKSKITANYYVYIPQLTIIQEICYPAVIDMLNNTLIIKHYVSETKNSDFTLDTFKTFVSKLREWDLTENFQVKELIYDNYSEVFKCGCCPFVEIEQINGKMSPCI